MTLKEQEKEIKQLTQWIKQEKEIKETLLLVNKNLKEDLKKLHSIIEVTYRSMCSERDELLERADRLALRIRGLVPDSDGK